MDFSQTDPSQQGSHEHIVGSVVSTDNRRQFGTGATFNAGNIAGANGDADYSLGINRTPILPQIDANLHSTTTGPLPIQITPSSAHIGITGSIFNVNSGPPIFHAASPPATNHASNKSTSFVESEIYARNLLLRRKGYPLWKPKAKNSLLPDFYKKEGIQIGDVGLLTDSGGFDYLFNICHDECHESNEGRVPRGFKPIILDNEIEKDPQEYRHGDYVPSHPSEICDREIESNLNKFDMGLSFTSTGTKGALLILPEGGERVDHRRLRHFASYITANARSWHAHIFSGPMGRGEYDDSLYLVTGYDKARAWGMACFDRAEAGKVHLDFVWKAANNNGPEYWFHRCDSAVSSSGADSEYRKSGCVFLRGFRITLRDSWRFFKASSEVTYISHLDADKLIPTSPKTIPTPWRQFFSWFSGNSIGIQRQANFNNEADSDFPSKYAVYHPSDVINKMILDNNKQVDIAITHDNDWASAIQENDNEMPQDQELIHRVCGFPLQCIESGGYTSACIIIPTQQSVANAEHDSTGNPLAVTNIISDLLLVIFIHGFKGDHDTFRKFPERLQHVLTETIPNSTVECIVFPAYETKGELTEAVIRFSDWLTELTVTKEVAHGGTGKAKVVLCGHSTGGLLAADSILEFYRTRPDATVPLWPNIIVCIAFDTPYYGLHPYVFKNTATKAAEYANAAKSVGGAIWGSFMGTGSSSKPVAVITAPPASQSGWAKWAPAMHTVGGALAAGGALVAGGAPGGAYWRREDLDMGYSWATDHMKYVRNLRDEDALKRRIESLIEIEKAEGVIFRTFYTLLPAIPLVRNLDRTFMVLPSRDKKVMAHFLPAVNNTATDELQAHTGMFTAHSNDGYYKLGLETAGIVREAVMLGRGVLEAETAIDPELEREKKKQAETEMEAEKETQSSGREPSVA